MSRKSASALEVVPVTALPSRIEPPSDLTSAQADVWRAVVSTKPVDWFQADTAPILAEYCRAKVMCDLLAAQIEGAMAGGEAGEVKALLDMRDKESRRLTSIATKLRLTNQSRYTPQAANTANKRTGSGLRPWQS